MNKIKLKRIVIKTLEEKNRNYACNHTVSTGATEVDFAISDLKIAIILVNKNSLNADLMRATNVSVAGWRIMLVHDFDSAQLKALPEI